jgi:hypothetical protein
MSHLSMLAAAYVGVLGLLMSGAEWAGADPFLGVIDIRPIFALHPEIACSNALGLAYNPDADVLYLGHSSDPRGAFIYTMDFHGNLLNEFDLQSAYQPGAFLKFLSYDRSREHHPPLYPGPSLH